MHCAFRMPCRAGSEKPDGYVVAVRVSRCAFVRLSIDCLLERKETSMLTANNERLTQIASAACGFLKILEQRFVDDCDTSARVFEIILVIFGGQERVDHRNHCADATRPEPRPDELRAIGQDNQHAILNLQP